jgi:hypothetical protein
MKETSYLPIWNMTERLVIILMTRNINDNDYVASEMVNAFINTDFSTRGEIITSASMQIRLFEFAPDKIMT